MKFLMGSHYWNLNIEGSDNDYLEYIVPTKEDLYYGNFTSVQSKDENGDDVNVKDIRLLFKELRKGSLISFQVLYSKELKENIDKEDNKILAYIFEELEKYRDEVLEEVKPKLIKSCYGELTGRVKKFEKLKETKELANIVKLNFIIKTLLENENPFRKWFEDIDRINLLREVRILESEEVKEKYSSAYEEALSYVETLKDMEFGKVKESVRLDYLENILMNQIIV
ncbi:MAG: hypothetical protein ACRCWG_06265 [Sarcina sp.]